MARYICEVPFIPSMGSISPFEVNDSFSESKEEYTLWYLNSMRDHDGLRHLTRLPTGTKFTRKAGK